MSAISKTDGGNISGSIALPGQKLATSKHPRMLTPSEIDLLRQDLRAALSVLGQDEIADARTLLREHGFASEDFEIGQRADPTPSFPSAITGSVDVSRKSNSKVQTYSAGHGSSWLSEFDDDLKSGVFGRPA